jgi:hypothetical protein
VANAGRYRIGGFKSCIAFWHSRNEHQELRLLKQLGGVAVRNQGEQRLYQDIAVLQINK